MSTLHSSEQAFFDHHSDKWWDATGPFADLHRMNPARLLYVNEILQREQLLPQESVNGKPLATLKGLDVGCGGGIATEPLARMGAQMTAIDASQEAISVASKRAKDQQLPITYEQTLVEDLTQRDITYDFIISFEVLEHIDQQDLYFRAIKKLLKPGGVFIFSTINRTMSSYLGAIVIGEHLLKRLPKGTHQWNMFLKPAEIAQFMRQAALDFKETTGLTPTPKLSWRTSAFQKINFIGYGINPVS